jgi:hypothetical protein
MLDVDYSSMKIANGCAGMPLHPFQAKNTALEDGQRLPSILMKPLRKSLLTQN